MMVECEYYPRSKHWEPLITPLKFVGTCLGKHYEEGFYKVKVGCHVYKVPVCDMNEVKYE